MTGGASGYASRTVAGHLVRGGLGFGALVGAFVLLPFAGPVALLLLPLGLVALRGCPTCWVIGLLETVSRGRLRRECVDGRCELRPAADRARAGGGGGGGGGAPGRPPRPPDTPRAE
ncbi:hypothetical protein, partial [Kitasatospora purpeofusca]|uniref:hypothetical protein n=1 Tax=Kitasatospora purpeofusca TaxID=67352 RepID=UPI0035E15FF0